MLFLEQAHFQRLLGHNLLQIAGFLTKIADLISVGSTGRVTSKPPLASLHEVL